MIDDMDELPQVVWLRGDEPHCSAFSLDAEAVMQRLGIKRTRLTQISGRELRVGRIRRGRYVAPVYRLEDVEAYAAWTRPTAAHLKSSQVLEDAARALAHQGDAVAERVHDDLEHLLAEVADDFRARGREQERLADDRLARLTRRLDELECRAVHEQATMQEKLVALLDGLTGMRSGLDRVVFFLEVHNRELAETKAAVARLGERTEGLEVALEARFAALNDGLAGIQSSVTVAQESLTVAVGAVSERLDATQNKVEGLVMRADAALSATRVDSTPPGKQISIYRRAARQALTYGRK